jgi:U3 small nucleolar RNA-associated protein 10
MLKHLSSKQFDRNIVLKNPSDVKSGSLRLEILVELIRCKSFISCAWNSFDKAYYPVAVNPQTFNQALLLISSLSRLAPEAVLHHIMPVFTFMGSNVFHRDDSYSFRVVEQVNYSTYSL